MKNETPLQRWNRLVRNEEAAGATRPQAIRRVKQAHPKLWVQVTAASNRGRHADAAMSFLTARTENDPAKLPGKVDGEEDEKEDDEEGTLPAQRSRRGTKGKATTTRAQRSTFTGTSRRPRWATT